MFHHQLEVKQDMASNFLSPLAQKMAYVLLIIALRQFWYRGVFFGTQALPKNMGAYVDDQNWQTGLTGVRRRSDRLGFSCSRSDTTDRSDRSKQSPSTTRVFHRFRSYNRISYGASCDTLGVCTIKTAFVCYASCVNCLNKGLI